MKRPQITPGPFVLKAGRNIETPSGTFYLAYERDKENSAPFFKCPNELTAIAKAAAALPDLLEALEAIKHAADDSNLSAVELRTVAAHLSEHALRLAGYEF